MSKIIFRKDEIIKLCKNKKVLHLGFIQHSHLYKDLIKNKTWLHEKIANEAKSVVGIDYLEKEVDYLKSKYGYECYFGDVTKLGDVKIKDKFDIIVCGELIEHIENAGLMLDGIKRFMANETKLIITTPNPWSLQRLNLMKKGILEEKWLNPEHSCWYSFQTLKQLLERKKFKEVDYNYYYGQENKDYFTKPKEILSYLDFIYKKLIIKFTKKYHYDGLFFVAKIGE